MLVRTVAHRFSQPIALAFSNETIGRSMNQNVTFGGTPELIFDGGSGGTEWSNTSSGTWNFADSGKVTITNGVSGNFAKFDDAGTIDPSAYTSHMRCPFRNLSRIVVITCHGLFRMTFQVYCT